MGKAPAFNIELRGVTEAESIPILSNALEKFLERHSDFSFEGSVPVTADIDWYDDGVLEFPDEYNTDDPSYRDSIDISYLDETNEYFGNTSAGLIFSYSCYYGEDMEMLLPKLEVMDDLYVLVSTALEASDIDDGEVEFMASVATI